MNLEHEVKTFEIRPRRFLYRVANLLIGFVCSLCANRMELVETMEIMDFPFSIEGKQWTGWTP